MRKAIASACAFLVLAAGCHFPKYARFSPSWGGFLCDAPWNWRVVEERQGRDYASAIFAGPLDPEFYLGTPSLGVRWYAHRRPHVLPDGSVEAYASAEDFLRRVPGEIYGPNAQVVQNEKVKVASREATHLRIVSPTAAPGWRRYGLSEESGSTRPVNLRDHSFVVVPGRDGFFVIVYPATRQGYDKYKDRFNRMVNTFRVLSEVPSQP